MPATPGVAVNGGNLSFNDAGQLTPRFSARCSARAGSCAGFVALQLRAGQLPGHPGERFNMTTTVSYDITDNLRAKVMLNFVNSTPRFSWRRRRWPTDPDLTVTLTPAMQTLIQANAPDLWIALQSRPNPLGNVQHRPSDQRTRHP
jgi:iron complex outermembrane receptor protein